MYGVLRSIQCSGLIEWNSAHWPGREVQVHPADKELFWVKAIKNKNIKSSWICILFVAFKHRIKLINYVD